MYLTRQEEFEWADLHGHLDERYELDDDEEEEAIEYVTDDLCDEILDYFQIDQPGDLIESQETESEARLTFDTEEGYEHWSFNYETGKSRRVS